MFKRILIAFTLVVSTFSVTGAITTQTSNASTTTACESPSATKPPASCRWRMYHGRKCKFCWGKHPGRPVFCETWDLHDIF